MAVSTHDGNPRRRGDGSAAASLGLFTREAERGVLGVLESQLALSAQIERLSTELHQLKAAELPAVEPFTASLLASRKRVAAVNATLVQVQERLARMDKLAASLPAEEAPPLNSR